MPEAEGAPRYPRRWPLFRLIDALVAAMSTPRRRQGVLVLRMFGIGDALLFRAVVAAYAEALGVPLEALTVLGSTAWRPVAELYFRDVKIELIDERRFARNPLYRLTIMLRLRRRGFATAICGMHYRQPHVVDSLMLASGAATRIVARPRADPRYDGMIAHYLPAMTRVVSLPEQPDSAGVGGVGAKAAAPDAEPARRRHEIDYQLAFLSAIAGRAISASLPRLGAPEGAAPLVAPGERFVLLNLGASYGLRRWPLEHHLEMARRLLAKGRSVLFLGGPGERDLEPAVRAAVASLPGGAGMGNAAAAARALVAIDRLDFAAAARLVAAASAVVSSDTGLGHLAILFGRPSVIVVGGGHFGSFVPYPPALAPATARFVYHAMPCFHCDWACWMKQPEDRTFPCVALVTVEAAWRALEALEPSLR
jgi:hypothetical protein